MFNVLVEIIDEAFSDYRLNAFGLIVMNLRFVYAV